LIKGEYLWPWH